MNYVIAVDSGGTFTDTIVLDSEGRITAAKAASTPDDFARGVLESVSQAAQNLNLSLEDLLSRSTLFAHGTTVATNALLTRSGVKTGLITTRGHEDALLIGRTIQKVAGRSESEITHLAQLDKADPIIPRPLIRGVRERIDYKGAVIVPLNEEDVRLAAAELAESGCEAIAVSLLWSFLHPAHERRVREIIVSEHPQISVSVSHELAPVIKEYERTATTAINAYIGKTTSEYLARLSTRLEEATFGHEAVIMQSSGGVAPAGEARHHAVSLLLSGPAGGVTGAVELGRVLGHENLITTDVGGTSFDVGLVVDGEPQFSLNPVFAQYHTVLPSIDISSIGAGGGSIAWIEPSIGLLKVGPRSAGAAPGPVCYGSGGTEPTVTDANVVLNRLNPDFFLGGRRKLHADLARDAIQTRIAEPLGLSLEEAALGIIDILDARMADLVRKVTIGRGFDPCEFALLAFGGAGPLHVAAYARDVGVQKIIIPAHASEFSAWGIAASELVYLRQLSVPMAAPFDPEELNRTYAQLEKDVRAGLRTAGVSERDMVMLRTIDMRYRGQIHEVRVPVPTQELTGQEVDSVVSTFEQIYNRKYGEGAAYRQAGIECRTCQVRGVGRIPKPKWERQQNGTGLQPATPQSTRNVYFKGGYLETSVFSREQLHCGQKVAGPAVIEAVDTTILVHPGQSLSIDEYGNCVMSVK